MHCQAYINDASSFDNFYMQLRRNVFQRTTAFPLSFSRLLQLSDSIKHIAHSYSI